MLNFKGEVKANLSRLRPVWSRGLNITDQKTYKILLGTLQSFQRNTFHPGQCTVTSEIKQDTRQLGICHGCKIWQLTVEQFVVSGITLNVLAVNRPVKVCDKAGMTLDTQQTDTVGMTLDTPQTHITGMTLDSANRHSWNSPRHTANRQSWNDPRHTANRHNGNDRRHCAKRHSWNDPRHSTDRHS